MDDCLLYNTKYDAFTGDNEVHCNTCRYQRPAVYNTRIFTVPTTLILLLNRVVGLQYKIKLEFTEYLDQYTIDSNLDPTMKWIYKRLSSVVTHFGESGSSGHFVAHSISQTNGLRYIFNDARVSLENNFKEDVIDRGMPYLLFYTNMDPHNMLRFISNRVNDTGYRDSISGMFESLNEKQKARFAYLLMRAADNDVIYNYLSSGVNCGQIYLSNLICATFELIKTGQDFDDDYMEQCRIIICEMADQIKFFKIPVPTIDNLINWINTNTFCMNKTEYKNNIKQKTAIHFKANVVKNKDAYIELFITNNQDNNIINNTFNSNNNNINNINIQQNINDQNNNIINNNFNIQQNMNDQNNINGGNNSPELITIKFEANNNTIVDCVVNPKNCTLAEAFKIAKNSIMGEDRKTKLANCNYKNPMFLLNGKNIESTKKLSELSIVYDNNITFAIEEQFQTYNQASKSKFGWLKFALSVICAIATIVLIVLELYWIASIPFVFMFLPFVIPKLCKSCCGCFYPINSSYDNKDPSFNSNNNGYEEPQLINNQNIINNQIQN